MSHNGASRCARRHSFESLFATAFARRLQIGHLNVIFHVIITTIVITTIVITTIIITTIIITTIITTIIITTITTTIITTTITTNINTFYLGKRNQRNSKGGKEIKEE